MSEEKIFKELQDPEILTEKLTQLLNGSITLGQLAGLEAEQLESMYAMAVDKFDSGAVDSAKEVLSALCFFDMNNSRNWYALGQCHQAQKNYRQALETYSQAAMRDIENVSIWYQMAVCHFQVGEIPEALSAIDEAQDNINNETLECLLSEIKSLKTQIGKKLKQVGVR